MSNAVGTRFEGEPLAMLFDLGRDPFERSDLSAIQPELVARLRSLVRDWECQPSVPTRAATPNWDATTLETLRSLGYVQ